jgi:hypothetical protein
VGSIGGRGGWGGGDCLCVLGAAQGCAVLWPWRARRQRARRRPQHAGRRCGGASPAPQPRAAGGQSPAARAPPTCRVSPVYLLPHARPAGLHCAEVHVEVRKVRRPDDLHRHVAGRRSAADGRGAASRAPGRTAQRSSSSSSSSSCGPGRAWAKAAHAFGRPGPPALRSRRSGLGQRSAAQRVRPLASE